MFKINVYALQKTKICKLIIIIFCLFITKKFTYSFIWIYILLWNVVLKLIASFNNIPSMYFVLPPLLQLTSTAIYSLELVNLAHTNYLHIYIYTHHLFS